MKYINRTFSQYVMLALLCCNLAFADDSSKVNIKASNQNTSHMVYGPFQFQFTLYLPFGSWGGSGTSWAAYMASCPTGTTQIAGLTASQFTSNAVACGCGVSSKCIPPYLTSMNTGGAGVKTMAVCQANATGWVPKPYLSTVANVGGFNVQSAIITADPSGNAFYYTLDNNMFGASGTSPANAFPGFPGAANGRTFIWTGHTCQHPY